MGFGLASINVRDRLIRILECTCTKKVGKPFRFPTVGVCVSPCAQPSASHIQRSEGQAHSPKST